MFSLFVVHWINKRCHKDASGRVLSLSRQQERVFFSRPLTGTVEKCSVTPRVKLNKSREKTSISKLFFIIRRVRESWHLRYWMKMFRISYRFFLYNFWKRKCQQRRNNTPAICMLAKVLTIPFVLWKLKKKKLNVDVNFINFRYFYRLNFKQILIER